MNRIDLKIKWLQLHLLRLQFAKRLKRAWTRNPRLRRWLAACWVAGVFLAQQNFDFTLLGTLILLYFGLSLVWRISSRISAALALVFLASCPVLLMLGQDALAETMAVQAYYLLVVTVVLQLVELKQGTAVGQGEQVVWKKMLAGKNWLGEKMPQMERMILERINGMGKLLGKKERPLASKANSHKAPEKKITQPQKKKIAYILLGAFLLLEMLVVFFSWSVITGVFCYLWVLATLFPKQMWKVLFILGIILAILSIAALASAQKEWMSTFYVWLLGVLGLLAWTAAAQLFRQRDKKRWLDLFNKK
ncbi:MAG: hypothetical protein WC823_01975 [Parcubacteria group bacterium]|jgi:hypothetical protein